MARIDATLIRLHEEPELFRAAVTYTAAQTAFPARLIEKDYFCTVLLARFAAHVPETMVFKGGTCLAKVHAGFYRLSEDLDFAVSMPVDATRSQRSRQAAQVKKGITAALGSLSLFSWAEPIAGRNNSMQYIGTLRYSSAMAQTTDTIRIDVSFREPLLTDPLTAAARTILIDPISTEAAVAPVLVRCISRIEAMAEKFRAALTRRDAAIRDFYDLHYAVANHGLAPGDPELLKLVRKKLAVPGNDAVNVSPERLADLRAQLETQLRPVLRQTEFEAFDLDGAFRLVRQVAAMSG